MDYRSWVIRGIHGTHERVLLCTADLTDKEANRTPAGLTPIIWQLGHLTLIEAAWAKRGGVPVELPQSYASLFKIGSGGQAAYPPLAEVRGAFERTHQALLEAAATADYDSPTPTPPGAKVSYSDLGELMVSACVHRTYHIGKMTTLRALLEKKRLFG